MPAYPGTGQATLLNTNSQAYMWNAERVVAPGSSIAFQLERQKSASYPFGASFELLFSGAPGTFNVDIQTSDTDQDSAYVTVASLSSVNSNNAGRVELPNFWAKYCRGQMTVLTNNVNTTLKVTR